MRLGFCVVCFIWRHPVWGIRRPVPTPHFILQICIIWQRSSRSLFIVSCFFLDCPITPCCAVQFRSQSIKRYHFVVFFLMLNSLAVIIVRHSHIPDFVVQQICLYLQTGPTILLSILNWPNKRHSPGLKQWLEVWFILLYITSEVVWRDLIADCFFVHASERFPSDFQPSLKNGRLLCKYVFLFCLYYTSLLPSTTRTTNAILSYHSLKG